MPYLAIGWPIPPKVYPCFRDHRDPSSSVDTLPLMPLPPVLAPPVFLYSYPGSSNVGSPWCYFHQGPFHSKFFILYEGLHSKSVWSRIVGKAWSREILSSVVVAAVIQNEEYCGQMMELLDGVDTTCPCSCAWWALAPVCTDPNFM